MAFYSKEPCLQFTPSAPLPAGQHYIQLAWKAPNAWNRKMAIIRSPWTTGRKCRSDLTTAAVDQNMRSPCVVGVKGRGIDWDDDVT